MGRNPLRIDLNADRAMLSSLGLRRNRTPWRRLLHEVMQLAGAHAEMLRHSEKPWASVTFSGSRHTVSLGFSGADAMEAADDFIAALPDHEFAIGGQIVADATIVSVDQRALPEPYVSLEAELLLVEDA